MKPSFDERQPIVEKCIGCERIVKLIEEGTEVEYCAVYLYPEAKWRSGGCPMASHLKDKKESYDNKLRVGQQKHKGRKKK